MEAGMKPEYQTLPDEEDALIRKASQGSLEAFNQLVLRYQQLAYQHAYALLGEAGAAEDITQESFIKAFRSIRYFRGGSFRGWLLKIVTNTTYDLLRRTMKYQLQPLFPEDDDGDELESPAWLKDPSASVEETVEQNEEAQRLYQLMDELPDIYRSVLTLVDVYELGYWEAAQALDVPMGTVKSRLARARLQMQQKIREDARILFPITRPMPAVRA
jgi:RNA polymerase sigma-70 factor (ECF subfamily)